MTEGLGMRIIHLSPWQCPGKGQGPRSPQKLKAQ